MADAKSVRAGRAHVELSANDGPLQRGLAAASRKLQSWGASLTAIGTRIALGSAAALSAGLAAVNSLVSQADALNDMANRTGIAADALSELQFAAEQSGTTLDELETGVRQFQRTLSDAAGGGREASSALRELGLSVADLSSLSGDEQLARLADGLSTIENPARRTALAMQVLGRSGTRLLPMLTEGAEGLARLRGQGRDSGAVLSAEDIRAAAQFGDQMDALKRTVLTLVAKLGASLLPIVRTVVGWIQTAATTVSHWIDQNRGLVAGIGIGIAVVAGLGAVLVALGIAAKIAALAMTVLGAVVAILTSPISLLVVLGLALGGVLAYLVATSEAGSETLALLGTELQWLGGVFRQVWGGIVEALAQGDLAAAGRIAWAGLRMIWERGIMWLRFGWHALWSWVVDRLQTWGTNIGVFMVEMWSGIRIAWNNGVNFIKNLWPNLVAFVSTQLNNLAAMAGGIFADLVANIPQGVLNFLGLGDLGQQFNRDAINRRRDQANRNVEVQRQMEVGANDRANADANAGILNNERRVVAEMRARLERDRAARAAGGAAILQEGADAVARIQAELDDEIRALDLRAAVQAGIMGGAEGATAGLARGRDALEAQSRTSVSGSFSDRAIAGFAGAGVSTEERILNVQQQQLREMVRLVMLAQNARLVFAA